MKSQNLSSRVEQVLDLPVGTLSDAPRIELSGNRRAVVEGCERILACEEDHICLRTTAGTVRFTGRELCMNCRASENAVITGRFVSVEFL